MKQQDGQSFYSQEIYTWQFSHNARKEGKLFDIKDDANMTFLELAKWYLDLEDTRNAVNSLEVFFKDVTHAENE